MNKHRRKELARIKEDLVDIVTAVNMLINNLEGIKGDEEDSYDNMPEGLQNSDAGERSQAAIEALTEAWGEAEGMAQALETIENSIDEAIEA